MSQIRDGLKKPCNFVVQNLNGIRSQERLLSLSNSIHAIPDLDVDKRRLAGLFHFSLHSVRQLLKDKTGLYASVIFVFGLLSFAANPDKKKSSFMGNTEIKQSTFVAKNEIIPNTFKYSDRVIVNNLLFSIQLGIVRGKEKTTLKTVPVGANSFVTGSLAGYHWEPTRISASATKGANYTYTVAGVLQWKLLGATLYLQNKIYSGEVALE